MRIESACQFEMVFFRAFASQPGDCNRWGLSKCRSGGRRGTSPANREVGKSSTSRCISQQLRPPTFRFFSLIPDEASPFSDIKSLLENRPARPLRFPLARHYVSNQRLPKKSLTRATHIRGPRVEGSASRRKRQGPRRQGGKGHGNNARQIATKSPAQGRIFF